MAVGLRVQSMTADLEVRLGVLGGEFRVLPMNKVSLEGCTKHSLVCVEVWCSLLLNDKGRKAVANSNIGLSHILYQVYAFQRVAPI